MQCCRSRLEAGEDEHKRLEEQFWYCPSLRRSCMMFPYLTQDVAFGESTACCFQVKLNLLILFPIPSVIVRVQKYLKKIAVVLKDYPYKNRQPAYGQEDRTVGFPFLLSSNKFSRTFRKNLFATWLSTETPVILWNAIHTFGKRTEIQHIRIQKSASCAEHTELNGTQGLEVIVRVSHMTIRMELLGNLRMWDVVAIFQVAVLSLLIKSHRVLVGNEQQAPEGFMQFYRSPSIPICLLWKGSTLRDFW